MKELRKIILTGCAVIFITFGAQSTVLAVSDTVLGNAIKTAGEVGVAAINMTNNEVKLVTTNVDNDTSIQNSGVVGNAGVGIKGDKIELRNSTLDNKTTIKNSGVYGNTGIEIGSE